MSTTLEVATLLSGNKPSNLSATIVVPDELRVLEKGELPPADCGVFRILSSKDGDKRIVWNNKSIREINAAKEMFINLIKEGLTPYKVGVGGKATSEVMKEFDPSASEVIFLAHKVIRGG
jgi:hypothetical protein